MRLKVIELNDIRIDIEEIYNNHIVVLELIKKYGKGVRIKSWESGLLVENCIIRFQYTKVEKLAFIVFKNIMIKSDEQIYLIDSDDVKTDIAQKISIFQLVLGQYPDSIREYDNFEICRKNNDLIYNYIF